MNLFCEDEQLSNYGYFVPKFVPRPSKVKLKYLAKKSLYANLHKENYFCMSVIGNLSALQNLGYINHSVQISDDLIFKLGVINSEDADFKPIHEKHGTFFPAIYHNGSMIYYRPVYLEEVEIDFSKKLFLVAKLDFKVIVEKVLCSIYLKYGKHIIKPKKWEVYAQYNLQAAYIIDKGEVKPRADAKKQLKLAREKLLGFISEIHPKLKQSKYKYFNGIHLSYNRDVLRKVPSNIHVLDTSLSRGKGYHPTIEMYCKIFKKYA